VSLSTGIFYDRPTYGLRYWIPALKGFSLMLRA
jgi:hypothetical protein